MKKVAFLTLLLVETSCIAQAAEPNDPRDFVASVFKAEAAPMVDNVDQDFVRFLTTRFRKAVNLDRKEGEIGFLDHDPVCMCQDSEGMHFSILAIGNTPSGVNVSIRAGKQVAKWRLVRESGGWKIADISEAGWMKGGSLLNALERENKRGR